MAKGKAGAMAKGRKFTVMKASTSSQKVNKAIEKNKAMEAEPDSDIDVGKGKRALVTLADGEPMGKNAAQETMNELKRRAKAGDPSMLQHYKSLTSQADKRAFALRLSVDKTAITLTRCRQA